MRHRLLALFTLVLLAGAVAHAQQPSSASAQKPGTTFKTGVNVVEVHAVVTDERGKFVIDLSKDDFAIYEDGKLQTPSIFQLMDVPVTRAARSAALGDGESDVRATSRSFDGRLYVLVLDDLHTMTLRSQLVRDAARRFIDQQLGDNDLAAVVFTSGRQDAGQELTSSRRLLRAAINRFQGQKLPSATAERLAIHMNERAMERAASESSDDSSSSSTANNNPNQRIDDPFDGERGMNARRALGLVREVAQWMSDVQGRRKALVLFSEGIDYDIYDVFNNKSASSIVFEARDAIAEAQRANVAIYAVDPRGLTQLGDEQIAISSLSDDAQVDYGTSRGFQRELLLAQESLFWLAEDTGGIAVVRNNDVAGGLRRIAEDNSRYYVLGYVTDPHRSPGKFRKLDVRVKRPGLKVRARRGYLPEDLKAAAKKREMETKPGTSPALIAALRNPLPIGELPVRVVAAPFYGDGKNTSVLLAIELDAAALKFDQRDDRFANKIEVSIVAADHQGKVRDTDRQEINLKLKPETHRRFTSSGLRVLSRLDLPPARYQIRVGVHEAVGGAIATVPYDLEVPEYSKKTFALSGVTITSSAAASLMTLKPDQKLKDVFPAPPVATRVFRSDEVLGLFAELYDSSTPLAHSVDFAVTVRSASDGKTVFTSRESRSLEASPQLRTHGYKGEIPLRGLAPGQYVLRVEAVSRMDDHKTHREVPFEVLGASAP